MWAAKMDGEGAKMWEACEALRYLYMNKFVFMN
jgi:hypothetical protein